MRILVLQFTPALRRGVGPRFDPELGTLIALLRQRAHEVHLQAVTSADVKVVKAALARALPQLVYSDLSPVCMTIARRVLQYVHEKEFLPVVAGGRGASIDPGACLSLPGVVAAALGEPDASLVTYFERLKDPTVRQIVQGIWLRDEQGLARPALPHLVEDLDSLPMAERELFDYAAFVRRTGQVEIAIGRGCPQRCGYCMNPTLAAAQSGKGAWVRRRSPQNILDEVQSLREAYPGVKRVRFLDHAFALDADWLGGMLAAYRARCDLPFRCHLRANAIDAPATLALAAAGCDAADVELISGSNFIRNEIFDMDLSEQQIGACAAALKQASIRMRAIVYLGAPYESEASLEETRQLLLRLRPAAADVRAYYPWPGTPALQTVRENGWLHPRGEEQYHADACGIDMPACRPAVVAQWLHRLRAELPADGAPRSWWRRLATRARLRTLLGRRSPQ